jgi:mannose-6-phosphate isomerase class I
MASADGSGGPAATAQEGEAAGILAWSARPRPLLLHCGVQRYAWGDPRFIPDLLGLRHRDATPHAELWIGAHPDLPAAVQLGADLRLPLDRLIATAAEAVLGTATNPAFGAELPFLLKVLAAARPLSIQVHPNRDEARQGFAHEEALGIPVDDPRRNYRDRNHKPELLVALTDFHALRGFRPLAEISAELAHYPALAGLTADLDGTAAGLRRLYADFMRLPQADVDDLLAPVLARSRHRAEDRTDPGRARCRLMLHADRLYSADGHHDRGLLSFLLLNLLHLRPGQAMFLPAGELHSYLAGAGLELMANSNNVLRGGLTNKHIDVDALLEVLHVHPHAPEIIDPQPCPGHPGRTRYDTPAAEFALERLRLPAGTRSVLRPDAVTLGLVLRGAAAITGAGATLKLGRGGCVLLPAGVGLEVRAEAGADDGVDLALATVPVSADAP